MSFLIKGMEMPRNCYGCPFFAQVDYWNKNDEADILSKCKRTGEFTWESVNGYLPNCPLVPVPSHGRLIDADALADVFRGFIAMYDSCPFSQLAPTDKARRDELQAALAEVINAPTIIEAEEGET